MARHLKPDLEYIWRGVITHRYGNGEKHIEYAGPYTAKSQLRRNFHWKDTETTVVVQRSKLVWEDVAE